MGTPILYVIIIFPWSSSCILGSQRMCNTVSTTNFSTPLVFHGIFVRAGICAVICLTDCGVVVLFVGCISGLIAGACLTGIKLGGTVNVRGCGDENRGDTYCTGFPLGGTHERVDKRVHGGDTDVVVNVVFVSSNCEGVNVVLFESAKSSVVCVRQRYLNTC